MATLIKLSIDTKKIKKSDLYKGQYLNLTVAINDQVNDYNQNVSAWVSQTKEDRENEAERKYLANGATIWTDGQVFTPEKEKPKAKRKAKAKAKTEEDDDGLPW